VKNELKGFCHTIGIEYVGIAHPGPYRELEERLKKRASEGHYTGFEEKDIARRVDPRLTLEGARSVIVCLFPYFAGNKPEANLSKSTFSLDYHHIASKKLNQIGEFLKSKINDFKFKAFVDNGPLVDRYLAYSAGLGFFGVNSHIITDTHGSYVFIGYIINNYPFEFDKPLERTCIQCGNCVKSCPGCAILGNFDVNPLRCRSYITQKKEELSDQDVNILKKHHLIYGCDICQDVCPHNQGVEFTNISEFKENLKYCIDYNELSKISNKEFLRRYKDRAFSWRGKKILVRNFGLLGNKNSSKI
jgi:epoxyqueuosine reductase